jgi:hypothetical protein
MERRTVRSVLGALVLPALLLAAARAREPVPAPAARSEAAEAEAAEPTRESSDFQLLLDHLAPVVDGALKKEIPFLPIGAILTKDGKIVVVDAHGDASTVRAAVDMVLGVLEASAAKGVARATALCMHVSLAPSLSERFDGAVTIFLEHESGVKHTAGMPYVRKPGGEIEFGKLLTLPLEAPGLSVFPSEKD